MNDDRHSAAPPPNTDGWVEDSQATHRQPPPSQLPVRTGDTLPEPAAADDADEGKALALLSHASLLFGIPVFILPMLQKDNRFALHHSKAAAVNFICFTIAVSLTIVTCGLAFPLIFVCYVPAIVGAVRAANGELAGSWGWGRTGERLFSGLQVPDPPKRLPPSE